MNKLLLYCAIMLLTSMEARVEDSIKTWGYTSIQESEVLFYAAKGNDASKRANSEVTIPDGQNTLEVSLREFKPDSLPWDIQLLFIYDGGLQAGHRYEVSFLCKATARGVMQMVVAQSEKPWNALPGTDQKTEVSQNWQAVTLTFTAKTDSAGRLAVPRVMLGKYGEAATLYFGPVTLRDLSK